MASEMVDRDIVNSACTVIARIDQFPCLPRLWTVSDMRKNEEAGSPSLGRFDIPLGDTCHADGFGTSRQASMPLVNDASRVEVMGKIRASGV